MGKIVSERERLARRRHPGPGRRRRASGAAAGSASSEQGPPGWTKLALDEALGAEALLLGRRSYEFFAARWPSRSGELADRLNSMPKYVVSSTLDEPEWNNSTVLKGDVVRRSRS